MENKSEILAGEILAIREEIANAFEHWTQDDENEALVQEKFSALFRNSKKDMSVRTVENIL